MYLLNKITYLLNLKKHNKISFESLALEWLEEKKISVKQSTYYKYLASINKYILPEFCKLNLEDLLKYNFNSFISKLIEKNYSSKNIKNILYILKAILHYIEDNYDVKFKLFNLSLPPDRKKNLEILTNKEKNKLENYCIEKNTLKSIGILICLNTGLRIGEICALKWENIDLNKQALHITSTMQRIYNSKDKKTAVIIDTPKTKTSMRDVPISSKLYNILNQIKKQYKGEDYFLTGSKDIFIEPRSYQNTFKTILKDNKIKHYNFHILRHTFATNCVEIGMDIKSLSTILGHANVNITLNQYVHSSFKTQKKYLEKL